MSAPSIAYYITAHGFGHGVRSCDIIRAFNELYPEATVHIVTELPSLFLTNHIGADHNPIHARSFDMGMVQIDSVRVDVDATLHRIEAVYEQREQLIVRETAFLRGHGIGAVVVDVPAMPLEAAALAGVPRLAVGNFGWDWIYSGFVDRDARWGHMSDLFQRGYEKADLLCRLPFSEEMRAFPAIEDVPLVARPGRSSREKIARLTGSDPEKKWVLLSFTTLEWSAAALARIAEIENYELFSVLPLTWPGTAIHVLDRRDVTFSDVVASVDAVISKPGFGILSDCVVNAKPLIYVERSDFLEYPILEAAIKRFLKHLHIPAARLYEGNLTESLDRIWDAPEAPERQPAGGDLIVARRIAEFLGT